MTLEQIKEILEVNHLKTKTLKVAGAIGKSEVYTLSVPRGSNAVRAWMDVQDAFDGYCPIITGQWAHGVSKERSEVTRLLKKAGRLDGAKILEQRKQKLAKDWKWHGDCDLADDGIPERLHGKWPKTPKPRMGFDFAWDSLSGRDKFVQMLLLPTENDLDAPAWMGFGEAYWQPLPEIHLAMLRYWNQAYNLDLFGMHGASFEVMVNQPPRTRKAAMQLAREQFFYCPDLVAGEEGTGTVEKLAATLLGGGSWKFRWDGAIYNTLNTRMSPQESWRVYFEKERGSFKEILSWDRFENWDLNTQPESTAQDELGDALDILYSGKGKQYSKQFLELALERVKRAFRENKFKSPRCRDNYPENAALATRCLQYTQALLTGAFSSDEVLAASKVIEKEARKGKWCEIRQAEYLNSVRMALICGDRPLAAKRLAIKRSFKKNQQEHKIWKRIAATSGELPLHDASLLSDLDAWFDKLRHAAYRSDAYMETDMVRFEAAAIRYKYFVSKNGAIDWKQVVKQVNRAS